MTRLFALVLALLLPLQWSWAAVGAYCEHETAPVAARHFGHHSHVHQADHERADRDHAPIKKADGKLGFDSDCAFCHIGANATPVALDACASPMAMRGAWANASVPPPRSALDRAPDRPQWPRLA